MENGVQSQYRFAGSCPKSPKTSEKRMISHWQLIHAHTYSMPGIRLEIAEALGHALGISLVPTPSDGHGAVNMSLKLAAVPSDD
jgi:hypothetical protein